jgi:thymidylate synthase ThyX
MIEKDIAIPINFRKNQKGMQAGEKLDPIEETKAKMIWTNAAQAAIAFAKEMANLNIHKQYVNRILEPFSHISVVLTSTNFDNFFALRYHEMAQPEFYELAKLMYEAYISNKPKRLKNGEWHLPFITKDDIKLVQSMYREIEPNNDIINPFSKIRATIFNNYYMPLIKMSVARCARVSYLNHQGKKPSISEDFSLYNRLVGSDPKHSSPAEHCASPMFLGSCQKFTGNFNGWIQFRKLIINENITKFNK